MRLVKVGTNVYQSNSIVAVFMLGAWYQPRIKGSHREMVPCSPEQAAEYDALPDAATCPITEGEVRILEKARQIVEATGLQPGDKTMVLERVGEGVHCGLRKYGPFDPTSETRDLLDCAAKEARNIIVYTAMQAVVKPSSAAFLRALGAAAVQLLVILLREQRGAEEAKCTRKFS